jgi:hypothetical protein
MADYTKPALPKATICIGGPNATFTDVYTADEVHSYSDACVAAALAAAPAQPADPVAWPAGWFESPHGAFRANPHVNLKFPSELLGWQIPLYTHPPTADRAGSSPAPGTSAENQHSARRHCVGCFGPTEPPP